MQQPFAAAMAAGLGLHTRRGKATTFAAGGEWVAIHCGQNDEHLKNAGLLAKVRALWPDCPSDNELRAQQRCVLGIAHFVDGGCDASAAAKHDFFLQNYDCSKPVAWRADAARCCSTPLPYPKGNLQVWHLTRGGFAEALSSADALLALVARDGAAASSSAFAVKMEEAPAGVKFETKSAVKSEVPVAVTKRASASGKKRATAATTGQGLAEDANDAAAGKVSKRGIKRELDDLGPMEMYRPKHRGATVTAVISKGPPAPRAPRGRFQ